MVLVGVLLCLVLPASATVIILANGRVPESLELAEYYMQARGIPVSHLCVLDLPAGEQMSRHDYVRRLRDPLLVFLREGGWITQTARPENEVEFHETPWITTASDVQYIVSMYGVPVRIGDTRLRLASRVADHLRRPGWKNMAAVDSELALILAQPYSIAGPASNPVFGQFHVNREIGENNFLVVATRLDGPDAATVRRMIDGALLAEQHGLQGRFFFDAQGLSEGAYFLGDYWIREAHDLARRAGFETVLDLHEETWSDYFPVEHAAVYLGWYDSHITGPFRQPDFAFPPGAIAYHIHSGSAARLRTADRHWTGPLLKRGAAVSMGAVSEPFLIYTPDLRIFMDRLLRGHTFGDAAYMSQSVLSWQMTFVGDPLYRPFAVRLPALLSESDESASSWAHIQQANLWILQGRVHPTLLYLQQVAHESGCLMVREKLADLLVRNDFLQQAGREYGHILESTSSPVTAARVAGTWMRILRAVGADEQARMVRASVEAAWSGHPALRWLDAVEEQRNVD